MTHISFSELKNWKHCSYYHKLVHIDKLKGFLGNEYTAFGTAIHDVCEYSMLFQKEAVAHPDEVGLLFEQQFLKNLKELPQEVREGLNKSLVTSMREQAKEIIPAVLPAVAEYFGDHTVVSTEEKIYVPIKEFDKEEYFFKGYIDLVIKTPDDRYHIIDLSLIHI